MFICAQLCLSLCDPRGCSLPGSSVHRFPRKGYWSGSPFLPPGDLPDPRIRKIPWTCINVIFLSPYHLDVLHQQEISSHSVTWESSRKYKRFKNIKGLKRSVVAMGFKGGTMNILSLENFQDHEIICGKLLWWTHVIIHLSRGMECTSLKEKLKGKLKSLSVYCPCRFISGNKCSLWWGKVSREIVHVLGQEVYGKRLYLILNSAVKRYLLQSWYWCMHIEYFLEYIILERWTCFYL